MRSSLVTLVLALSSFVACDDGATKQAQGLRGFGPPSPDRSTWVALTPGTVTVGSPDSERCREPDESQVRVVLTRPFDIAKVEVSQRAFQAVMGYNPSFRKQCPSCPVDSVTFHEATAYCNALSDREGLATCERCSGHGEGTRCEPVLDDPASCPGYRLPSEAEWEYAARAGTETANYAGPIGSCMGSDPATDAIAWYKANSMGRSQPAGQKRPNAWGLFDMLGNVYEWTSDWYAPKLVGGRDPRGPEKGDEKVLRGGSWYHNAEHARAANRHAFRPGKRLSYVGFRCVRTTP